MAGDRRVDGDSLQALVIQLHQQARDEFIAAHARIRDDIADIKNQVGEMRAHSDLTTAAIISRVAMTEKDITIIQTQRSMEEKQHAKQATFISLFVSAAMAGGISAFKAWLGIKP